MAERLVVFGSGGHAKVVIEAVRARFPRREIIILDDAHHERQRSIFGIRVAGGRDELGALRGTPVVPAIGDNGHRGRFVEWLRDQGHSLESVVHPSATVADSVQIGPGAFVSAGAIAIAEARIGTAAIVNTGATVDHDCVIGEAAHVAPGVHLCGNVTIGARTLVGAGSSIRPGISVCDDVLLGAGSVVVHDIVESGTFAGNPARRLS
jgi:sugar O-acyltransferase (sialic acid O-acetyltransferase NeuD family)